MLRFVVAAMLAVAAALGAGQATAQLAFPESGSPAQRARALWKETRPHVLADAAAALGDAEYMKRRQPIWGAWIRLQMETAGEDERVSRLIPDVLRLLNDTYGWTADAPAKRQEIRDRRRPFTGKYVEAIDGKVAALK